MSFTTHGMERCQIRARLITQIYNFWSLYARLVDWEKHREVVPTRPELLGGVARQTRISVNLSHAKSSRMKEKIAEARAFLQSLITASKARLGGRDFPF